MFSTQKHTAKANLILFLNTVWFSSSKWVWLIKFQKHPVFALQLILRYICCFIRSKKLKHFQIENQLEIRFFADHVSWSRKLIIVFHGNGINLGICLIGLFFFSPPQMLQQFYGVTRCFISMKTENVYHGLIKTHANFRNNNWKNLTIKYL